MPTSAWPESGHKATWTKIGVQTATTGAGVPIVIAGTGGHSLIPFGRIHPASRSRVASKYGILKIVPNYPSLGRWVQAFKTTTGQTLDRVQMSCH